MKKTPVLKPSQKLLTLANFTSRHKEVFEILVYSLFLINVVPATNLIPYYFGKTPISMLLYGGVATLAILHLIGGICFIFCMEAITRWDGWNSADYSVLSKL